MVNCRYVGSGASQIGDLEFTAIGQQAAFSEVEYADIIKKVPFIPEKDFARINFTQGELDQFGDSGLREDPPQEFLEKVSRAQAVYRDISQRMSHGENFQEILATISDVG